MHAVMKSLKSALAYAKFYDNDVAEAAHELVDQLGSDLDSMEQDYEPGAGVEKAQKELEEALNNVDSVTEDTEDAIRNADTTETDEEEQP